MMAAPDILESDRGNAALVLGDGELAWLPRLGCFRIRPLRPADRAAYDSFGARVAPDDLRLRFAGPIKLDGPVFAALFQGVDHDRLEAFAAFDDRGEILGIAHIARTGPAAGDIALVVRSDVKRRGLGQLLLDRLVRHAEGLGLAELTADILFENRPMLSLVAEAGFRMAGYTGGMAALRKDLQSLPRAA